MNEHMFCAEKWENIINTSVNMILCEQIFRWLTIHPCYGTHVKFPYFLSLLRVTV